MNRTEWRRRVWGTERKLRVGFGRRGDPSGTAGIVRQYQAEVRRRFATLVASIRNAVVDLDVLRLGDGSGLLAAAAPPEPFTFPRDPAGKARAFMEWITGAIGEDILDVTDIPPGAGISPSAWQQVYVRSSYSKGAEFAYDALQREGIDVPRSVVDDVFNQPIAAQKLALIHTRQFEQLRGIGEATAQVISRELTTGLAQGIGPREMARNLANATNRIGRTRALLLARTETMFAHAESTIDRYAEAGVRGVSALAEFATAGDDRVCPQCEALEASVYDLNKARGLIPVHPNCRCVWLPVL